MTISAKKVRLALRSPGHFLYALRLLARKSALGKLETRLPGGYAFKPNLLSINITARCNLRCAMCMQPRSEKDGDSSHTLSRGREELSPQEWMQVIDQAAPSKPAFYFTGGEPLLYKGMMELLAYLKKRGMIAALVTNGTLLDRNAEEMVRLGVDSVTISLDGPGPVHDAIRGVGGTFQKASDGIRALRGEREKAGKAFPKIKVNCVLTPDSIPALLETYKLSRDLGVDEISFQHPIFDTAENVERHNCVFQKALGEMPLTPDGAGSLSKEAGEFYDTRLSEEEFTGLLEAVKTLEAETRGPDLLFFPEVKRKEWRGYYLDMGHPFEEKCFMPWRTMRFLPDGDFEPCLHYVVGNVRETPLWDLWNHPRMRYFRGKLAQNGLFPACARCCYRCY